MKILQVVTQLEPAGAQTLAHWIENSALQGNDVSTQFLYFKSTSELFDPSTCLVAARPTGVRDLLRLAHRLIQSLRATDVVVAHTHYAMMACTVLRFLVPGPPRIVRVHHWPVSRYPRAVRLTLKLRILDRPADKDIFVANGLTDGHEGTVIPNPVPVTDAHWSADGVREDDILIVARHSIEKAIDTAIRALTGLPGRRLSLVGNGPETAKLADLSQTLGVADRVEFHGTISNADVRKLMSKCNVLVLPSRWEAMPMVLLEAVGVGAPIVVSDIEAHHFLTNAGAADCFEVENSTALARTLSLYTGGYHPGAEGQEDVRRSQSAAAVASQWRRALS